MTDQPTHDAIVSQRARDLTQAILDCWFNRSVIEAKIEAFQAEIEAATIERCAGELDRRATSYVERASQADDAELRETRNECALAMEFAATAIRNLKGQTS